MVDARMTPEELSSWIRMGGLPRSQFAQRLGVTVYSLKKMETGQESIPARFDDDVVQLVDTALGEDDDPGPGDFDPGD